jgi:hypothetical protein
MLTKTLIKPFIEDLEGDGVEDTTTYELGFMAGMAALSSILSDNIDNQAQLFVYLGMAISEGAQWVESQVNESPDNPLKEAVERLGKSFEEFDKVCHEVNQPLKRQPTPSSDIEPKFDFIPSFITKVFYFIPTLSNLLTYNIEAFSNLFTEMVEIALCVTHTILRR